jgi:hypothetical protein
MLERFDFEIVIRTEGFGRGAGVKNGSGSRRLGVLISMVEWKKEGIEEIILAVLIQ